MNHLKDRDYIAFDIDDVVAVMRDQISRVYSKILGKEVHHKDFYDFDLDKIYGVKFCPQTMTEEKIIENCVAEDDAKEVFDTLRDSGFRIAVITARGWHEKGIELTEKWLEENNLKYDELHVVGRDGKTPAFDKISQFGTIHSFIDDQPGYILEGREHESVRNVFMQNRPWNINMEGERVFSLSEFKDKSFEIYEPSNKKRKKETTLSFN